MEIKLPDLTWAIKEIAEEAAEPMAARANEVWDEVKKGETEVGYQKTLAIDGVVFKMRILLRLSPPAEEKVIEKPAEKPEDPKDIEG